MRKTARKPSRADLNLDDVLAKLHLKDGNFAALIIRRWGRKFVVIDAYGPFPRYPVLLVGLDEDEVE